MSNINYNAPSGWNSWIYARSTFPATPNFIQIPDASFPYLYTPASGFWCRSIVNHCLIPWLNTFGTFSTFLLAGGTTGTLAGALGGLTVATSLLDIANHSETFAVGKNALPPTMGFCLGNKFKQQVYTRMDVQNSGEGSTIVTNIGIDLLQNSRFKRAYIDHGSIVSYTNSAGREYTLRLDVIKNSPPPTDLSLEGLTLKITPRANSSGTIVSDFSVGVLSIKNNWDFVISSPSEDIKNDYYYQLSKPLCIEDPYLLSGFWRGAESTLSPPVPSSGLDLYKTSHNSPYEEGKFLGVYVWKANSVSDATTSTVAVTSSTSSTTTAALLQPISGSSMDDNSGHTWAFLGFGNSPEYPVYPNDTRYMEVRLDTPDTDGAIVKTETRMVATDEDYNSLIDAEPLYLRVEIGTGGYTSRHNWFAPCLKGEYIKVNGNLYKILNQVGFNILDVSFLDIKGTNKLDPQSNQSYSIINQSAWFLNEHYEGRISTHNSTGVFKGNITVVSSNDVTVATLGDTFITRLDKNGLSFVDRFKDDIELSSSFIKAFKKFQNWKLVVDGKEYNIAHVDFSLFVDQENTPYPIVVTLSNIDSEVVVGKSAYISFDSTFSSFLGFSKESGYSFFVDATAALSGSTNLYYLVSDVLCLDGEYASIPYKVNVSQGDRIGLCEGYLFGLAANGSAQSSYNQLMLFATPRSARGVASFYHFLRSEDWVAYEDIHTGKITLRRGCADFTELVDKSMIVIGKPESTADLGTTTPIVLDTSKEMLRRISLKFANVSSAPAVTTPSDTIVWFGLGSPSNIYGFYVSGDGPVNLGFLLRGGVVSGTTPSSTYTGYGSVVSPVYLYKPNYFQNVATNIVDIGVKTSEGPIHVMGGSAFSQIWAEYVREKQTLSLAGYYDILRLSHGENIIIYGTRTKGFKIGENINNYGANVWSNSLTVMISGTFDDSFYWNCPLVGRIDDADNVNQYALMVLNSTEYLGCIYNPMNETLAIFVRSSTDAGIDYLGCYILPIVNLKHKRFYCEPYPLSDSSPQPFLWKPPLMPDSFISDGSKSWAPFSNMVQDGFSYIDPETQPAPAPSAEPTASPEEANPEGVEAAFSRELFVRIMGSGTTNSQIQSIEEFGIISTAILPDGTYMVLHDSNVGVRAIFSSNNGGIWKKSNIIFARNARSGILVDNSLFYITDLGIEMKQTNITDFYRARDIAGISAPTEEVNLQQSIDREMRILIGSGSIELQRLSGYITSEGFIKIFFYDQSNKVKCIESTSNSQWAVANNF